MKQYDTAIRLSDREYKGVFLDDSADSNEQESKQNVEPELSPTFNLPELIVDTFVCRLFVVVSGVFCDCFKLLLSKEVEKDVWDRESNAQTHRHSPAQTLLVLTEIESDHNQCGVSNSNQYLQESEVPAKHAFPDNLLDLKKFKTLERLDYQEEVERLGNCVLYGKHFGERGKRPVVELVAVVDHRVAVSAEVEH